jgi:hypothetical protein
MNRTFILLLVALALLGGKTAGSPENTKTPVISARLPAIFSLNPAGAMKGAAQKVELLGENLDGAGRLEIGGQGVTAKILSSSYLRVVAEVFVQPDAQLGVHDVRLISPLGVSNLLGFRVGDLPEMKELEPNNSIQAAQRVGCPAVVDALLFPDEDSDFYRFHAAAGQEIVVEVLATRNGSGLNAEMYLLDASGTRLAVADDEEGSDPVITYTFAKEGDYVAVVRGVFSVLNITFPTGHPAYSYQVRISSPPTLSNLEPATMASDVPVEVDITGTKLDRVEKLDVSKPGLKAAILNRSPSRIRASLTAELTTSGIFEISGVSVEGSSHPLRCRVTKDAKSIQEAEPNNDRESTNKIEVPGVVTGAIGRGGDVDNFLFSIAEPGAYVFEIEAGRLNSLLDSVLSLYDSQGKVLATNDEGSFGQDAQGDARIVYNFNQPGEYRLAVRQAVLDLFGPLYTYRLIARKPEPNFILTPVTRDDSKPWVKSSDRLVAHPGSEITIPITVEWLEGLERQEADIRLIVEGLPEAIPVAPYWARAKEGKSDKQSRFTARVDIPLLIPSDAALGSYVLRVKGEAKVGTTVLTRYESIIISGVGRYVMASTSGFSQSVEQRYLSIVTPTAFALRPEIGDERYPVRFTMQPGTIKTLTLSVLPPENFPAEVSFSGENLPRGLSVHHVEFRQDTQQYLLHLKAAADCERGWFPLVIFVATDPTKRTTVPTPYFGMKVQ